MIVFVYYCQLVILKQEEFFGMSDEGIAKCIKGNKNALSSLLIGSVRALQKDASLDEALHKNERKISDKHAQVLKSKRQ